MNDNGSLYDFVNDDYEAPTVANNATVQTPHQNREDMSKPYSGQFSQKVKEAMAETTPKTPGSTCWWRFFTRQMDNNVIALQINGGFNRNSLTGENYASERARYLREYKQVLSN